MNPSLTRRVVVAALASLLAANASAQSPTRALPEPLVNALMGGVSRMGSGNSPEYFIGALPTGFPAALVPSGPVSIVGGARTPNEIVAVLADSTRRLATVIEELLQSSGYAPPPATPATGFSSASGPGHYFCKDSATVSVEPVTSEAHEMARVTYRVIRGRQCSDYFPVPARTGVLRLPPLKPFPGAQVSRSGGGGGEGVDSHAVVVGQKLDPAVLLAHYAAQLVQAGWKASDPAIGARVAAQFFEAPDDIGKLWQGTLMVSGSPTAMNLSLVMSPH